MENNFVSDNSEEDTQLNHGWPHSYIIMKTHSCDAKNNCVVSMTPSSTPLFVADHEGRGHLANAERNTWDYDKQIGTA